MTYERRHVQRTETVPRYYNVKCDGCEKPLEPASMIPADDDGGWENLQTDEGMSLHLQGDWSSQWDGFKERLLFCDECVAKFGNTFPHIGQLLVAWKEQ